MPSPARLLPQGCGSAAMGTWDRILGAWGDARCSVPSRTTVPAQRHPHHTLCFGAFPICTLLSGIPELTRITIGLLFAALAYIASGSWAIVYESAPDALLLCVAVDDAAQRSWRQLEDGEDGELFLQAEPGVTADTSFVLWSSLCIPVVLRKFISNLSKELEGEDPESERRPTYAGSSRGESNDESGDELES